MIAEPTVEKRTYSVLEVARIFGIGRASAYSAVRRGDIPSIRIGNRVVCPKAAIDAMIEDAGREQTRQIA